MSPPDGFDQVRALRARGQDVEPPDPPPGEGDGGRGGDPDPEGFLPPGCPVVALGVSGDQCWYLDQLNQLRMLKAKDHGRLPLQNLFGQKSGLLRAYWPRKQQDKQTGEWLTTGWKPEEAAEALMAEAARKGVWSPQERVRGPGAWVGKEGELILHAGDVLLVVGRRAIEERAPGLVGDMVYPTGPGTTRPWPDRQKGGEKGPAQRVLGLFETWKWRRPDVDPHLLLGWVAAAMLGGALSWRVVAWITGGYGTGKSTLQNAIKWLLGPNGMLQTSDATAAAVRQILKHASLPVAIDEAEAEEDGRQMAKLIKLARDAATGALAVRGGADHEASQFTIRSCFLFSSILIPPLPPQDRSRMAILELDRLGDAKPMKITERGMNELGARLMRRLADNWHRWPDTVEAYREAMQRAGHSARGQDVFGTLLACADLLLNDDLPDASTLAAWEHRLAANKLQETDGDQTDESSCLTYILSTVAEDPNNRLRLPIGQWIGRAADRFDRDIEEKGRQRANQVLQEHGLKVVQHEARSWLAVANQHAGLARLFRDTHWRSPPDTTGVWVQALRRLSHVAPKKPFWIGASVKATLLPIDICLPAPGDRPAPTNGPTPGPSTGPGPSAGTPGGASASPHDIGMGDPLAYEDGRDEAGPSGPDPFAQEP